MTSKTELESQGDDRSERRTRRIVRECVAYCCEAATQAKWHGFQPICIAKSLSAVRCSKRTSDCYEVNRVSVAPRGADAVGSLKQSAKGGTAVWARRVKQSVRWTNCSQSERGGLRCANAEVQTREEGGIFIFSTRRLSL